jgi:hypothetical protein
VNIISFVCDLDSLMLREIWRLAQEGDHSSECELSRYLPEDRS